MTLSRVQLARHLRSHVSTALYDESYCEAQGTAIYMLCDPRDLRLARYVGQTRTPRRRLQQHLNAARLWMPQETPWWIRSPQLRPLYEWIRALYRDEERLPVMVIATWVEKRSEARLAERSRIFECLSRHMPLLNVEGELLGRQLPLI